MSRAPARSTTATELTRLETSVLRALIVDLRDTRPDIAAQLSSVRPERRLNTGFGLYVHLSAPARSSAAGVSGDVGAAYAMVAHLPDPVAFSVRVQGGRVIGLVGDSYGQDTRALDFAAAHVGQVFTVDASGRSIPLDPLPTMQTSPAPRPPRPPSPAASSPTSGAAAASASWFQADARRALSGALRTVFEDPDPREVRRQARAAAADRPAAARPTAPDQPASAAALAASLAEDRTSLLIGAWVVLAVVALLAVLLFDVPWVFAVIAVFWIGAALRKPRALDALQRGVRAWSASAAAGR